MNIFKGLYIYQKKKFPVKFLFFTTLASVMCSAAVVNYQTSIIKIIAAFFAVMFFLFHIRVIDEIRDFKDDAVNHPENPVHNGTITIRQLFVFDIIGLLITIFISIFYGKGTMIFAGAILIFTTIASKDFFIRNLIVNRNFLYHIINSPQMILLQLYIFTLLTENLIFTKIIWFAVIFVYMNIFVLEVVRKIKLPQDESPVADTFSKSMGFRKSLIVNYVFSIMTFISFYFLISEIDIFKNLTYFLTSIILLIFVSFTTFFHLKKQQKKTEKLLLLSVLTMYVGLNLLVCLYAI